jgi:outer membrane receptor protein involved in Fe transport
MSRSASDVIASVPFQVWALVGFGLAAVYVVRQAAGAVGGAVDAVGAAVGGAVQAAEAVAYAPVAAMAATEAQKQAAIGSTAKAVVVGVSDAVQSVPGVIPVLDAVFGVWDSVFKGRS